MEATAHDEFFELIHIAEQQCKLNSSADHVIVIKTAKNRISHYAGRDLSHGGNEDADQFIQMVLETGDSEVNYVVCACIGNVSPPPSVGEIPPYYFRQQLLAANPQNMHSLILLATEPSLYYKELKWTMPG